MNHELQCDSQAGSRASAKLGCGCRFRWYTRTLCRRAALVIQHRWQPMFLQRQAAAVAVQRAVRGLLARRSVARSQAAAVLIQVQQLL